VINVINVQMCKWGNVVNVMNVVNVINVVNVVWVIGCTCPVWATARSASPQRARLAADTKCANGGNVKMCKWWQCENVQMGVM
jgi:hypothetical protein